MICYYKVQRHIGICHFRFNEPWKVMIKLEKNIFIHHHLRGILKYKSGLYKLKP